jgi:hypothetical protein
VAARPDCRSLPQGAVISCALPRVHTGVPSGGPVTGPGPASRLHRGLAFSYRFVFNRFVNTTHCAWGIKWELGSLGLFKSLVQMIFRAMAVAPLSHSARDYVRAFDLTSIALWRDGRIGVSRNPTGAEQAWWCSAKAAGPIVRAANANGKDVAQAAARLHMPLTPHAVVAERVCAAVSRIDAGLNMAKQRGDLASSSSAQALRRLRKAVADAAANGGVITRSLMLNVFGE